MDFQASKNPRHTENIRQAGIPIRHVMDSCIMRHMGRRIQGVFKFQNADGSTVNLSNICMSLKIISKTSYSFYQLAHGISLNTLVVHPECS